MKIKNYSSKKPYAIVIGVDGINGLQAARILSRRGIPVIGLAKEPKEYCCRTRVCEEIIFTDTESKQLIETLESLGPKLPSKAVIFPCYDLNVLVVSRYRQRLANWFHIRMSEPDVIEMMLHKSLFYTFAHKGGFPIPRTLILNNREDAERAAKDLAFPCILKPPIRAEKWEKYSRHKVYKSDSREEFLALYDRCALWSDELVVQEWVNGPDSNLYTCYCYFSANSDPLVTFVTRKIRQWPPQMGEGCSGVECRNDDVLQETLRLFKSVHLQGLGYLELKRDLHSGKYLIMEPNIGRPTSKAGMAEAGGVEMLYTMYSDAVGRELPEKRVQKYGNAKWIFFRRDLQSAFYYWRRGDLTFIDWLRSLRGKKIDALFSWTDLGPFVGDLIRSFRLFFKNHLWLLILCMPNMMIE